MQTWPLVAKVAITSRSIAASSSAASASRIAGSLPPSSSSEGVSDRPASSPIARPAASPPVKATRSTPGCPTSAVEVLGVALDHLEGAVRESLGEHAEEPRHGERRQR